MELPALTKLPVYNEMFKPVCTFLFSLGVLPKGIHFVIEFPNHVIKSYVDPAKAVNYSVKWSTEQKKELVNIYIEDQFPLSRLELDTHFIHL